MDPILPIDEGRSDGSALTRASQALILCAKCLAALHGRINVCCDDVRHLALPVLRHRISCSFAAEAEGVSTDDIIRKLLEVVPERKQ